MDRLTGGRAVDTATAPLPWRSGRVPEPEANILWDGTHWAEAQGKWIPGVSSTAAALPALGGPDPWPACMRNACLVPGWATEGADVKAAEDVLHWLFGMGLSVMMLRMCCERAEAEEGRAGVLFPNVPIPGRGRSHPWGELPGPLLRPAKDWQHLQLMPGLPRGGKWDLQLAADILRWARCLQWTAGEVTYAELALNLELTVQRVLPARPKHALHMTVLPL